MIFLIFERLALRLLRDDAVPGLHPSAVARSCHKQFQHVLVDEYQDINEVQDAILHLVSRECLAAAGHGPSNLFCVGDVKQSIYRFRLAEPTRFLNRSEEFRRPGAIGKVIDLQANFRSRAPLLDVLNNLFERLMTKAAVGIQYDQTHRLHAHAQFAVEKLDVVSFTGAPVELHLLPKGYANDTSDDCDSAEEELGRATAEATLVAHQIRTLMGLSTTNTSPSPLNPEPRTLNPHSHISTPSPTGHPTLRPLQFRDIVILLRSAKFQAETYAQVLRDFGIPVYSASGVGYFESMEVRDVLSLLRLLDNQQQDIPMAAVLRSPLSGLPHPEDNLARIRLAYPAESAAATPIPFHQAVVRYAAEIDDELAAKLRDFLNDLGEWREMAHRRPVAEVIWQIYDRTGFLAFCNGLENGQQRCANLINLYHRAQQFGSFSRQGLWRFIQFLRSLSLQNEAAQASEISEAEDVVRIMTIHSAKGLEFPVVFLPDMGKKINMQDCAGDVLADREALLGLSVVDERKQVKYPSLAKRLVADRLRQQALAEELRVLYVATTRAKEHLILVGSIKDAAEESWAKRWTGHAGPLPAETILDASTMLDWLGPAAVLTEGGLQIHRHTEEDLHQYRQTSTKKSRTARWARFPGRSPTASHHTSRKRRGTASHNPPHHRLRPPSFQRTQRLRICNRLDQSHNKNQTDLA